MVSRIFLTAAFAILAVAAFCSEGWAQTSDHLLFLFVGIVAGGLAVLSWFGWETLRAGWNSGEAPRKDGGKLPALAWSWPLYISAIYNLRRPPADAPNDRPSHPG
jgi:threonine/homoserine/homoserine lactone efflux protein